MSDITVTPAQVSDSGARLQGIAADVASAHAAVAGTSGAAEGTSLSGAYEDLLGHFAAVLPLYSRSSASLSTALGSAGTSYVSSDQGVGKAFTPGSGGGDG